MEQITKKYYINPKESRKGETEEQRMGRTDRNKIQQTQELEIN